MFQRVRLLPGNLIKQTVNELQHATRLLAVTAQVASRVSSHQVSAMTSTSAWAPPPPCQVGDPILKVDTPCLIVEVDTMMRNITKLHETVLNKYPGIMIRSHVKAHKCPQIAKLQVEKGATGMCCQTLTEAEAMVFGGGSLDILISNQIIGESKLKRVAKLAKQAQIAICVDDKDNIQNISAAAQEEGVCIDCVVEVNVGQDRCGVEPGSPAADLAEFIVSLPGVQFKGLQGYHGLNQHIRSPDERQRAVEVVANKTKLCLEALENKNIKCSYVTGGGTGTYPYEAESGVFTEIQPGSYIFMDADYGRNFMENNRSFSETFGYSLLVATTVQSVSDPDRCVVDAGMKAVSLDSGPPLVLGHSGVTYICGGDEHGILKPASDFKVGQQLFLIPGHCDPTVNLHDWLVGIRNNKVESVWPVLGRGPGV